MKVIDKIEDFYVCKDVFNGDELDVVAKLYAKSDTKGLWNSSIKHPGRFEINGSRLKPNSPIYIDNQYIINSLFKSDSNVLRLITKSLVSNGYISNSDLKRYFELPIDFTYLNQEPTTFQNKGKGT